MLLIRVETPRDVGQVWMINIAAFEQTNEAFMIRVLRPAAMAGADGAAHFRARAADAHPALPRCGVGRPTPRGRRRRCSACQATGRNLY